jgi:phenylalanyl-tRNA synthetase beta chain
MAVVDVDFDELRRLTGHDGRGDEELRSDLFALGLEYEGETEDGLAQLELPPDRLDRLSVEGVARSLRYQYGEDRGVYVPRTNDPDWRYEVAESVPGERPYVTGAIARGVNMDETVLDSLIQLQEKLHATMGRDRVKGAIGIHDLVMLKGGAPGSEENAIAYQGIEPEADTFVPLDSDAELSPGEVLSEHPTGRDYAPIVTEYERLPAIYDDLGLFSFPPVINGRRTELSVDSTDLLIELTGTNQWTIDRMGAILCYALAARGATIEAVTISYPDRELVRPDFERGTKRLTHERIETTLGIDLDPEAVIDLAERSGLDAEVTEPGGQSDRGTDTSSDGRRAAAGSEGEGRSDVGGEGEGSADSVAYEVAIPPYRQDVLGPLDVIDDLGRAYGFNDLEPRYPEVSTVGGRHERSRLERKVRETLVGLGFEDLLNFHLIAGGENYERMGLSSPDADGTETGEEEADETGEPDGDRPLGALAPARIREPYSAEYGIVRTWALPSLMMVLENNTHRAYRQDLAEIGLAARRDEQENTGLAEFRTVAAVLARTDASYEAAKSRLEALCRAFGVELETPPTDHPTFIDGRAAEAVLDGSPEGVIGEVHPEVLIEHDLEVPVAAFEVRPDALR